MNAALSGSTRSLDFLLLFDQTKSKIKNTKQPVNIALQNPCGSLNQRCVQRFFIWETLNPGLHPGLLRLYPFRVSGGIADSEKHLAIRKKPSNKKV
jgi:hypothetical protein